MWFFAHRCPTASLQRRLRLVTGRGRPIEAPQTPPRARGGQSGRKSGVGARGQVWSIWRRIFDAGHTDGRRGRHKRLAVGQLWNRARFRSIWPRCFKYLAPEPPLDGRRRVLAPTRKGWREEPVVRLCQLVDRLCWRLTSVEAGQFWKQSFYGFIRLSNFKLNSDHCRKIEITQILFKQLKF